MKMGRGRARERGGGGRFGPMGRLSAQARAVYATAQAEAERLDCDYFGTEHLLLGLLSVEDGVCATVLNNLELKKDEIRARVEEVIAADEGERESGHVRGQMHVHFNHFNQHLRVVFQEATREAHRLNHRYVGPEHLLLGLVAADDSVSQRILNERGVTLERARDAVVAVLAHSGPVETEPGEERNGSTVVMCRVDDRALNALDTLIEAGICKTRSDAASWLIQAGIESNTSLFEAIHETVVEIRRLREVAQTLVDDASKRYPKEAPASFI